MLAVIVILLLAVAVLYFLISSEKKRGETVLRNMLVIVSAENSCRAANKAPRVDEKVICQTSKDVASKENNFIANNIKNNQGRYE